MLIFVAKNIFKNEITKKFFVIKYVLNFYRNLVNFENSFKKVVLLTLICYIDDY